MQQRATNTKRFVGRPPTTTTSFVTGGRLAATAAACVLLLSACNGGGDEADTETSELIGAREVTGSSETPDPTESESDPNVVADPAAATAVGERFVQAFADRDADAAVAELSDTPESVDVFGVSETGDLAELFAWFDVVDTTFEPQGCTFREPDQVACTAAHSNVWYQPVELAPVESRFAMKVEDEQITAVRWAIGHDHAMFAFDPFIFHVNDTNPDDLPVMFKTAPTGDFRYPQLTDQSLTLFEQNTAAYLASNEQ